MRQGVEKVYDHKLEGLAFDEETMNEIVSDFKTSNWKNIAFVKLCFNSTRQMSQFHLIL